MIPDGLRTIAGLPNAGHLLFFVPPSCSRTYGRRRPDGAGQTLCTGDASVNAAHLANVCTQESKAQIVVAVAWRVVVAIGGTQVPRIVVPTATTVHPVRALVPVSLLKDYPNGSDDGKRDCRNFCVSAWRIWAIMLCTDAVSVSTSVSPRINASSLARSRRLKRRRLLRSRRIKPGKMRKPRKGMPSDTGAITVADGFSVRASLSPVKSSMCPNSLCSSRLSSLNNSMSSI